MSQVADFPAGMCPADIGRVRQLSDPRVSPDGSAVAFTVADPDVEGNRYAHRIWLVPARGTGASPRPFTGPGSEQLPRWSPDGRRLAFAVTGDDGRSQICVLPVADGGERPGQAGQRPFRGGVAARCGWLAGGQVLGCQLAG